MDVWTRTSQIERQRMLACRSTGARQVWRRKEYDPVPIDQAFGKPQATPQAPSSQLLHFPLVAVRSPFWAGGSRLNPAWLAVPDPVATPLFRSLLCDIKQKHLTSHLECPSVGLYRQPLMHHIAPIMGLSWRSL
jgi:hypothetical protein